MYNEIMMKKSKYKIDRLIKYKNIFNQDIVFSSPEWPTKTIDGVIFVGVKMMESDNNIKWMRKDSLVKAK